MIDLVATLRLNDDLTKPLRQVSRQMTSFSDTAKRVGGTVGGMGSAIGRQANQLTGLKSQIAGVAGAYFGAQGAMKAFHATIGEAAQYEASEVAVKAIFNDDEASSAYLKMVDSMALDSPLLNSKDMLASSKGLVAMTKDVGELGKAWSIVERLQVLDPTQGTSGASFALKEVFQGDSLSMVERFGLDKKALNQIKKMAIPEQVAAISALLDGMGVTQATVDAMGKTTLGYWSQIGERAETFMRTIGNMGNSKIGDVLGGIVNKLDSINLDDIAVKFDAAIGGAVQGVIDFAKKAWEMREPIIAAAKVFGTFVGAIVGIVVVAKTIMGIGAAFAFLTSPIGLIAAGITGLVFGFKRLYDNSDQFRELIDRITVKAGELITAFQSDGISGLFDALLGEGSFDGLVQKFESLKAIFDTVVGFIRGKIEQLAPTIEKLSGIFSQVWGTISSVFSTAWTIISPILSGLWSVLQMVGDYAVIVFNNVLVPALGFAAQAFSTLWSIASPILQLLAAGFDLWMAALKVLWEVVLAPFIKFIATGVKNAFEALTDALSIIQGAFDGVSGKVSSVYDKIREFADFIRNVKLPDWIKNGVSTAVNFVTGGSDKKAIPGHYHGLDNVPYDNYTASLHRGEKVLTAQEAKAYREGTSGQGVKAGGNTLNFTFNGTGGTDEEQARRIAAIIAREVEVALG
ncbi:phage tail protein [Solibacillus ferritrahens]|uniref:phage tail protein n=1 Tax=Solibacillus ferritrahens TaxID=3098620 RepID=UPI00300AB058